MLPRPLGVKQFAMKTLEPPNLKVRHPASDRDIATHASLADQQADMRAAAQNRVSAIGVAMLILSILLGTAGTHLAHISPEIVKVVAVVIFVGSMLALAMGMIGETYR